MANRISDRMVKAFERFNADLNAFGEDTETLDKILDGEIEDTTDSEEA